jgi:oxalate decarboxylase/phosphoglucose isomerase-like protein (cupin superfamily)
MTMTQDKGRTVLHIAPEAGEVIDVLGDVATFKLPGAVSGGSLILAEIVTQPGGGPPGLHAHPTEEAFYVLEGEFEVSGIGDDGEPFTARARAGSVVYVPSEAAHNFRNVGDTPGRLLVIYTSPELERMARTLAQLPTDAPPEPATVMGILTRHGIRFVEPAHA